MAVYEQKSKGGATHWAIDFIWVDPKTGKSKRVRRSAKDAKGRPAKSRTAAEQHEQRIRAQLATGPAPATPSSSPTLAEYHATYIADARVRLKPQTIDYLQRTFTNSVPAQLRDTPIDQIDFAAFELLTRTLHDRGLKAKTINNAISAVRATLSHAVKQQKLSQVPAVQWQKLGPTKFDFFTFEEVERLIAVQVPLVTLAVRTGMRIGELLELKWSDIALERQQVTVSRSVWWKSGGEAGGKRVVGAPKNHKARTIPLSDDALTALCSLPGRAGYVFQNDGLPLTPSQCRWPIWRAQDAAQVRRTGPHVFRHTFASHLVMRGVPLPAVQALMGHGTIQMTMKYAHLAPDHLRSAIATLTGG